MKKTISILLLVLLIAGVITSCDNKLSNNSNETVSVTFSSDDGSRDLTSSNPLFNVDDLYWKYTAVKANDGTGLTQGATSEQKWIYGGSANNSTQSGLGVVGGFSQGLWKFTLYGYSDNAGSKLVCQGSTTTSIKFGSDNNVKVKVNPVTTSGNGTIDLSKLTVKCGEDEITNWSISSVSYNPTTESEVSGKVLQNVMPGTYRITITIKNEDDHSKEYDPYTLEQDITVYSNLTTTVTGVLSVSASSETVSVTFSSDDGSEDLTSSKPLFNVDALYWKYSAQKNSADNNPNLNSGATSSNYATDEAGAVKIGKGLNATLSGFSQGLWDFKLFAYKDEGYSKLAYGGEAKGVRLEWGKDNVVNVEVSPYSDQGPGTIDLSGLTVECSGTQITNWSISSVSYNTAPDESSISGKELTVTPGTYTIEITIIKNGNPLILYNSYTLEQEITVYSNLTTTVTGSISLTPALELNPIGGVIFYDADNTNGATYTFYDSAITEIEYKGNSVSELLKAEYYTVSGEVKNDRFFVLYTKEHLFTNNVYWGFYNKDFDNITQDTTGKSNTDIILKYIDDNGLYDPDNPNVTNEYKNCGDGNYMWDYLIAFRDATKTSETGNTTGLYDWYIPSYGEMWNLGTYYNAVYENLDYRFVRYAGYKTSSEYSDEPKIKYYGLNWQSGFKYGTSPMGPEITDKNSSSQCCVVIRSF